MKVNGITRTVILPRSGRICFRLQASYRSRQVNVIPARMVLPGNGTPGSS